MPVSTAAATAWAVFADIGGEAVGQPVRFGDDFVEIAEG